MQLTNSFAGTGVAVTSTMRVGVFIVPISRCATHKVTNSALVSEIGSEELSRAMSAAVATTWEAVLLIAILKKLLEILLTSNRN
jgi:hypothetical protein